MSEMLCELIDSGQHTTGGVDLLVTPPNRFFGWVKELFGDIATPTPAHTASEGFSGWVKELFQDITNPIVGPTDGQLSQNNRELQSPNARGEVSGTTRFGSRRVRHF